MSAEAQICIGTRSTTPSIPPVGKVCIWVRDSDGHLMQIDSSGTILDLTAMGATQLGGLSNVAINNPQTNEVLIYDGTNFVNTTLPVSTIIQSVTSGNPIATHTSGNGTPVQIFETVTTLSLAGDILTYINENGSNSTIDLSGYDQSAQVEDNASEISSHWTDIETNTDEIADIQGDQNSQNASIQSNTSRIGSLESEQTTQNTNITNNTNNLGILDSELDSHVADTNNPHVVTITQALNADPMTTLLLDIGDFQQIWGDDTNADEYHKHASLYNPDADELLVETTNLGIIRFFSQRLVDVADPTDAQDVVTKNYLDNITFKQVNENTAPLINQASNTYIPHQSITYDIPEAGDYLVEIYFIYSINTITTNFLSRININSAFSNELAIEAKDSSGVGSVQPVTGGGTANTGTDQKLPASVATLATFAAGTNTVAFEFGAQSVNQEATIYQSLIKLTRIP